VKKTWVPPSKKYDDPNDLNLTALQIVSSPEAKNAGTKRMQELYDTKKLKQILDIALEWPLYFSLTFPCKDGLTSANQLAVDHKAVYLLDTMKPASEPVKTCPFQDLEILNVGPKHIELKLGHSVHHIEASVRFA